MRTLMVLALAATLVACGDEKAEQTGCGEAAGTKADKKPSVWREPDRVTVDHILIGVTHPRLKDVSRSKAEAKKIADKIVADLEAGASWDDLKQDHSDDRSDGTPGGPYAMANNGVQANRAAREFPRGQMANAFGNVGFSLKVGEIGVAAHDPQASPFGFHIIKRVK